MLGKDALTRSAMAFAKSAEVDPSFDKGLVDLANTALRQRVNIKLGVALDALRRAASTEAATHPEVMLARGRVEREVGDGDSALAALQGYLEKGPTGASAQLEIARTLFLLGRFDGVHALPRGRRFRRLRDGRRLSRRSGDHRLGQRDGRVRPHIGRAPRGLSQAVLERARPDRAPGRRRAAARALPPPLLRPQELPAHLAQPPLRHRRALPLRAAATSTTAA